MATVTPQVIGTASIEMTRSIRPFSVRISAMSNGVVSARNDRGPPQLFTEGPSCIFVGPIETASRETLEALYRQAQDAYYSGNPLIVDDMFDRVEVNSKYLELSLTKFYIHRPHFISYLKQLKLRWYGSKYVVKYPRCSLKRQSTYSDAREDPSQVFALASVWLLFLGLGISALLVPMIYTISYVFRDALDLGFSCSSHPHVLKFLAKLNGILLGSAIGYPIASASVGALLGLWKNDLVALKGACPNCGEDVFAFVRSDLSNKSPHRADCHVCESSLEFSTKVEQSISSPGRRWVHGRIYLLRQRRRS